ncbi:MAG: hypothetical protein WAW37_05850 [Syntrophobacteraceae bacterium]
MARVEVDLQKHEIIITEGAKSFTGDLLAANDAAGLLALICRVYEEDWRDKRQVVGGVVEGLYNGCIMNFGAGLRSVFCKPGKPGRVDWRKRKILYGNAGSGEAGGDQETIHGRKYVDF